MPVCETSSCPFLEIAASQRPKKLNNEENSKRCEGQDREYLPVEREPIRLPDLKAQLLQQFHSPSS